MPAVSTAPDLLKGQLEGETKKIGIENVGTLAENPQPPRESAKKRNSRRERQLERIRKLEAEFARANRAIEEGRDKSVSLKGKTPVPLHTPQQGGAIGPDERAPGVWSGPDGGDNPPGERVVEKAEDWTALWSKLSSDPAPEIDFAARRVAAVFLGPKPAGVRARLLSADEGKDAHVVRWAEDAAKPAGSGAATAPYLLVTLPLDERAVRFKKEKNP